MIIETKQFKCWCCGIEYSIELGRHEPTPFTCDSCRPHDGAATVAQLRAQREDHKQLHAANIADMQDRVEKAERRTQSVYHTRDLAFAALNKISGAHSLRPNGSCSCNVKPCKVGEIIDGQRALASAIRSYDAREQRRLARIRREESFDDYADEWDNFADRTIATPDRASDDDALDVGEVS